MDVLFATVFSGWFVDAVALSFFAVAAWMRFVSGRVPSPLRLLGVFLAFRASYAAVLSAGQYYVWSLNDFTALLLPPYQPLSYFLLYSWAHFWLNLAVLSVSLAVLWVFFRLIAAWKKDAVAAKDRSLALLLAALVGWPDIVLFIPLALAFLLVLILFRLPFRASLKKSDFAAALFVSAAALFAFGGALIESLRLAVLYI